MHDCRSLGCRTPHSIKWYCARCSASLVYYLLLASIFVLRLTSLVTQATAQCAYFSKLQRTDVLVSHYKTRAARGVPHSRFLPHEGKIFGFVAKWFAACQPESVVFSLLCLIADAKDTNTILHRIGRRIVVGTSFGAPTRKVMETEEDALIIYRSMYI